MPPKKERLKFARDRKIYDRQPDEPDKAWHSFTIYRDFGPGRTLHKTALEYRKTYGITESKVISSERVVQGWSIRWKWKERVHEYTRMLDKRKRQKAIAAVEQMRDRHIVLANNLQVLGAQELQKWILKTKADKNIRVTVADLLRAIDAGVRLERLSRGEPETVAEERRVSDADQTRESLVKVLENEAAMEALDVVIDAVGDVESSAISKDDIDIN